MFSFFFSPLRDSVCLYFRWSVSGWTRYFQVLGIDEEEAEHSVVRAARDFVLRAGVSAEQILGKGATGPEQG